MIGSPYARTASARISLGFQLDLDWLRDFSTLAELKSFSRAAEARNVTQPAFSRRIRALEDWIGTPLFARGAQGASLTSAGQHFQPLAADLIRSLERAQRDTRSVGERENVALSIAATHALSFTFFPGWIRRHLRFEALGALSLISESMQGCEQIMLSGEVHFLLCHAHADAPPRFEPERFQSHRIGDDCLVPLCAPDSDGQPAWCLDGTSAQTARLLSYSRASGLVRILAAQPAMRSTIDNMRTGFTSHLAATLMTMAREGHGVAWLPLTLAREEIEQGRLVRAGGDRFDIPIEIRLIRSSDCRNDVADGLWHALTGN